MWGHRANVGKIGMVSRVVIAMAVSVLSQNELEHSLDQNGTT